MVRTATGPNDRPGGSEHLDWHTWDVAEFEGKKAVIVALPFIGTMLDIGGMWLTRFVWPPCAVLVLLGGSVFAFGYLLIAGIAFYELWLQREVHP